MSPSAVVVVVGLLVVVGVLVGAVVVLSVLGDDPVGLLISVGAAILGLLVMLGGVALSGRRRDG